MTITNIGSVSVAPVYSGGERAVHDGGTEAAQAPAPVQVQAQAQVPAQAPVFMDGESDVDAAEFAKTMEEPIRQANKALASFDRRIEREFHSVTKTLMYKIRDTKTDEVIAEYPPRKIQDMIAKMWELAGLFIDQKA